MSPTPHTPHPKILMFGTFDHLHPGHLFILKEGSSRGNLYVVVARDMTVERIKGHLPDHSQEERKAAIEKEFSDAHVMFGSDDGDYLKPVKEVGPDLILLGYDQKLPPGINENDLPCPIERLPALEPNKYKSSLMRQRS